MQLSTFDYELPDELIARYPASERTGSRLLQLDPVTGAIQHRQFPEILNQLNPGDCLVLNNTKVIPARLKGQKASGGQVELLIERIQSDQQALAMIRASKAPKPGTVLHFGDACTVTIIDRVNQFFQCEFSENRTVLQHCEQFGEIPIPPYFQRDADASDQIRYQTVYADPAGSVAAPTAGLHFDQALLSQVRAKGVDIVFVTCHVGAGTFQPVKVENITEHQMHQEWIEVTPEASAQIYAVKARGGRVIAVGTTAVRCLETSGGAAFSGDTDIFIYPGYEFKVIDGLLTNFHLPKSSLIMLVSAFAGLDNIKQAYQMAVMEKYRFYSYGDAMLLLSELKESK